MLKAAFTALARVRFAVLAAVLLALATPALAQKPGGPLIRMVQPEPPTLASYL